MNDLHRRRLLRKAGGWVVAVVLGAGYRVAPVGATKSKPVNFDISARQFQDDCLTAGGEFLDGGDGTFTCFFDGWRMECSKVTGKCRVICDAGVTCVKPKRLPGRVRPALHEAASQITPALESPPSGPTSPAHPGEVIDDEPAVVK